MFQKLSSIILFVFANCFQDLYATSKISKDSPVTSVNAIIEQAIKLAPAHDKAYANYQAEVFIQNTGKWTRIPGLWKAILSEEGVEENLPYQSESYAKFSVSNDNTYSFKLEAIRNNYHVEPRPDKYVNPNFYKNVLGTDAISPLSPKAFQYYQFQLIDSLTEAGVKIYRIRVIPKNDNDEKVFSGTISITAGDFALQSVDLKVKNYNVSYQIMIHYQPFGAEWFPVQYKISASGSLMGFEGTYTYAAKVWNYQAIEAKNFPDLARPDEKSFKEIVNVQERNFEVQQFKQVMSALGTNLKSQWSDANIASGLRRYDKVDISENAEFQTNDFWYQLKQATQFESFTPDLPISYLNKNSLPTQPDEFSTYRQANQKFGIGSVLFSRSYFWGKTKKGFYPYEIYYKSPVLDFNFNTVEGFVYNTGALFRYRRNRYDWWEIDPTWRYSVTQNRSMGMLKVRWKTQKEEISVSGGEFISQYNVDTPVALDLNSLSTLLLKKNFVKIYEKDFINISFSDRFSNTLGIKTSLEWARRYPLENTTNYYWINFGGDAYLPNFPQNQEMGKSNFNINDAFLASFQINYRPTLKKQYRNNIRYVDFSSSPLITFKYRGAIPKLFGSEMDFHTIELGITHNFPLSINTNFNYIAQVGTFLSANKMTFADYKHFNGNNNMISIGDALTTHRLVGFYDNYVWGVSKKLIDPFYFSTNGSYIDIMTMVGLRKFALTQLMGVRNLGIREELFANYLYTANNNIHNVEFGYGVDGILRILRVEAVFAYNSVGYPDKNFNHVKNTQIGIRISLNSRVRGGVTPDW
ncbi:DUF5686 family protein [Arcicella rigui]|uniref:DUF5686 family protein n=1 Tax=Arcicella rigui TaxID=797020 RepID=A0ABU5Q9J5_9BACT|nr:DUF5686 family protein [Arcicella rigui]MEA5139511.1 DUF5686 family protein [Arcicella rigui]